MARRSAPRLSLALAAVLVLSGHAVSAQPKQGDGYRVVASPHAFKTLAERVEAAVARGKMGVVTRASASEGAARRGVAIRGDLVYGVFRNDFAVRMLAANVDAGIEAPVRLHLTEESDGSASIRYWLPSAVFARYGGEELQSLARELDPIVEAIVADAAGPS